VTSLPPTVLQLAGPARRRGSRGAAGRQPAWQLAAAGALAVVAGGALLGVAWWWLAPTAVARVEDGSVVLQGHQELQIAQDGWFAVVVSAAGVVLATVLALRHSRRPAVEALLAAVGLAVAAFIAWRIGSWLGPAPLVEQVRAGSREPVTPLMLRTPVPLLLLGPLLFSLTRFVAALLTGDPVAGGRGRL
jgi:hypothetical protein